MYCVLNHGKFENFELRNLVLLEIHCDSVRAKPDCKSDLDYEYYQCNHIQPWRMTHGFKTKIF